MADGFGSLGEAYSILGQATTSEYKRRRKEEDEYRKKARRDQLLGYIAAPLLKGAGEALSDTIGGIISKPFEEKYDEFARSSEIVNLKRSQKNALAGASVIDSTYEKIMSSDKTQEKWFQDDSYATALTQAEQAIINAGLDPANRQQAIKAHARKIADKVGLQRSKAFEAARQERLDLGEMKDFDKLVSFNNKRPQNIVSAGVNTVKRFFGGKTGQELDTEGFKAISESGLVKERVEFDEAFKLFKAGASFDAVAPMLEASMGLDPGKGSTETKIDMTFTGEDDATIVFTQQIDVKDEWDNTVTSTKVPINIQYLDANEDGSKRVNPAAVLKALNTTNNLFNQAEKVLTPDALVKFNKMLSKNKIGGTDAPIILTALKSPQEHRRAAQVLQDFIQTDSRNLKDPTRDQIYVDFLKTMTTKNIPTYLSSFEQASLFLQDNNVEEAQRVMNEMFSHMAMVSNGLRVNPNYGQPTGVIPASSLYPSR